MFSAVLGCWLIGE